jgi:general secretion pathway protein F
MPIFEYKAFDSGGKSRTGIIDADSPKEARVKLKRDSLYVTDIHQARDMRAKRRFRGFHAISGMQAPNKRRTEHVAAVTRQMASLLSAGIPLAEALRAIIEQSPDKQIESVFRDIREKVTQGIAFGDAVLTHPAYFTELYSNMVKAGEASGALDQVMARLADFLQGQARLKNKVGAALIYPSIMVIVGVIVVAVLMIFVVPNVTQMLSSRGQDLPLPTKILIASSKFLQSYWWLVCLGIAALSFLFNLIISKERGRLAWDRFKLKVPVIGDLLRKQSMARFASTFSTLLRTGVPVLQGINVTKAIVGNKVLSNVLIDVHDHILEGTDIATPLRVSGAFPPLVSYMVAVGEQAGNLDEMLDRVAKTYDEEVEIATQRMTAVIEPLIIVVLAVFVGAIVMAIVLPLLQLNKLQ